MLIEAARNRHGLTPAEVAAAANMTVLRWSQLVSGITLKGGKAVQAPATDEQLATMAEVVRLTPEELRPLRPGAAELLARRQGGVDLTRVPTGELLNELARRMKRP